MNAPASLQYRQTRWLARGVLVYAALHGAVVFAWLAGVGAREGWGSALVCALPALAALWAIATGLTPPRSALSKVMAAGLFGPLLLLFWAGDVAPASVPGWPFFVPAVLLHAAVFIGCIVVLGQVMTRVEPVADEPPVPVATLRRRLLSLAAGLPRHCSVRELPGGTLVFELLASSTQGRHHRVLLDLLAAAGEVRVREELRASAAPPAGADEASLRGPGDAPMEAGRPEAAAVWHAVRQTSMFEPEQIAAVPLRLEGDRVHGAEALGPGDGVLLALCAVVTRSGWAWQPAWREKPAFRA